MKKRNLPPNVDQQILNQLIQAIAAPNLAKKPGKHGRQRKRLTRAGARKVFRFWRDACLKQPKKHGELFDMHLVWLGMHLTEALATLDGDSPANEWAAPAVSTIELLNQGLQFLQIYCEARPNMATKERARYEALEDKLDRAAVMIFREMRAVLYARKFRTRSVDLMLDILHFDIGDGPAADVMLRHMQKNFRKIDQTDAGEIDSENTIASFAWDTYNRVALLDALADEFPDHVRSVARQMHAWPILRHRHTTGDAHFAQLAERLQLGAEYPLDTGKAARFRPDSPMVRYLDTLVPRINLIRSHCIRHHSTTEREILHWWRLDQTHGTEVVTLTPAAIEALRHLKTLPVLTKATAPVWTRECVVPLIMETDARGAGPYTEPALEQIRRQRDIKSRAVFESRLESAVAKTLRSLARPS